MLGVKQNWLVIMLSGAGVLFILMGLMALAVPTTYEGMYIWQLDSDHTFRLMDAVGAFALAIGVVLTWLGGVLWKYQMRY
jgi:hypothetical protein